MNRHAGPASVLVDGYSVMVDTTPPPAVDVYVRGADLVDDFGGEGGDSYGFVAVEALEEDCPSLVLHGRFTADGGVGPGVVLIPQTQQMFVGAGTSLAAYDRRTGRWQLTWRDTAEYGFWSWSRHRNVVLMAAELEFAAWTVSGEKLWTRFVEPPWSYSAADGVVRLDVMGIVTHFPVDGPPA